MQQAVPNPPESQANSVESFAQSLRHGEAGEFNVEEE